MDKQKMVEKNNQTTQFPLVDALLLTPDEGKDGSIGVCTNTTASGQVFNEIEESNRKNVSVLGSLIVSRDGAERMILNALVHPTLKYLILFSEESLTFSPSTNLLQAVQNGFDAAKQGNYIKDGVAASSQYPNLSQAILEAFQKTITVLPLFMYKSDFSKAIVGSYLSWLKREGRVSDTVLEVLTEHNNKKKIYYDSLNELLNALTKLPQQKKESVKLNVKNFQHLQPPRVVLPPKETIFDAPFQVVHVDGHIQLDIEVDGNAYRVTGDDEFLIGYSLMRFLGKKKKTLSPLTQLLIGAELGRVSTEIANTITFPSFIKTKTIEGAQATPLEPSVGLVTDKKYYYKIGVKEKTISCMCMAFDLCEEVFELQSESIPAMLERLSELNRFEDYSMDILHRIDVGTQIARAGIAAHLGYSFIQDFASIFKINTSDLPFLIAEGDSFLDTHKKVLQQIYTQGITEEHGDIWKGPARTASVLAVYRNAEQALATMPVVYKQGDDATEHMREAYKKQLLRFDHDGSYSYGERTRAFFGFDQLERTIERLKNDPTRAAIVQRFDPTKDMTASVDETTGKSVYSHDPCLTHDIFFLKDKKLHSFHIARAHNTVNAYPENVFGLYDAYVRTIREALDADGGDMCMLSNRANILLLTEDQRTKKILGEPSKPLSDEPDTTLGPYRLGTGFKEPKEACGIAYSHADIQTVTTRPDDALLSRLENLHGVNTLKRAIDYLADKGVMHNNAVLSEYHAHDTDPQAECLVFFQANVFGNKLHATAVFANRSLRKLADDQAVCSYIATLYMQQLNAKPGKLTLFYVPYTKA